MKTDKKQFDIHEDEEGEKGKKDVEKSAEEISDKGLDVEVEVTQEKQVCFGIDIFPLVISLQLCYVVHPDIWSFSL